MDEQFAETAIARFWKNVQKGPGDDCWLWTGHKNHRGYGVLWISPKLRFATHVSLILSGRPRPPGINSHALHGDCSHRACVNPDHLRWGSPKENVSDRVRLKRSARFKGASHPLAKLTEDEARAIKHAPGKYRDIAQQYGVTFGLVGHIKSGRAWTHL